MPSAAVQEALDQMYQIDRVKARFYDWEKHKFRKSGFPGEPLTFWNSGDPLDIDRLRALSDLLSAFAVIRPLKVLIKANTASAGAEPVPVSNAPRFFHQIEIHPNMRQPAMVVHEVAHKVVQDRTGVMNHGPLFQGWFALLASKLVTGDQVDVYKRIVESMEGAGLTPVSPYG